jgi:ribosome maturation factor RimP
VGTYASHFFVLKMDYSAIENRIRELIASVLAARQVELVDLVCHPAGGRFLLRCLVDTPRGITLERLSGLNRAIGAILDEHDAVPAPYLLEVSSPGLDRPLKRWTDFERILGRRVRVFTSVPVDARTEHHGELLAANEETIVLRLDGGDKVSIELTRIVRAEQEIRL